MNTTITLKGMTTAESQRGPAYVVTFEIDPTQEAEFEVPVIVLMEETDGIDVIQVAYTKLHEIISAAAARASQPLT